ncbi:MAG: hypothetical protein J6T92_04630 [Ottowia sp.]|nr:hypothetical protein [Ottowia sp.]
MSSEKSVSLGLVGERLSRTITGTDEVCVGRSAVAAGCGAALGAAATGAVTVGATAAASVTGIAGFSALAATTAPVTVPLAVAAGAVALIRSLFD